MVGPETKLCHTSVLVLVALLLLAPCTAGGSGDGRRVACNLPRQQDADALPAWFDWLEGLPPLEIPPRLAAGGASSSNGATESEKGESLSDISRELDSPVPNLWALVFQNNLTLENGDAASGTHVANALLFQPLMPFPFGERQEWVLALRPVFPLVTELILDPAAEDGISGHETCLGDIQLLALVGPNRHEGWLWGLGPTFRFPTAASDILGEGKFQVGPAATLVYSSKPWIFGVLVQNWWSYAGDPGRRSTARTDLQYVIRYEFAETWAIGMNPTIKFEWRVPNVSDRVTVPVGLGLTKTFRVGKMPVRVSVEIQYSVVKPDSFGPEWNFRIQFVPIIPGLFE